MDWRRNKVRDLFSRGYYQYEISNILHMSQLTISRDINYVHSIINHKDIDPDDQLLDEYQKARLILGGAI